MSDTDTIDRPASPGSTCTAPISEPAWLKRAGKAVKDSVPLSEVVVEEDAAGDAGDAGDASGDAADAGGGDADAGDAAAGDVEVQDAIKVDDNQLDLKDVVLEANVLNLEKMTQTTTAATEKNPDLVNILEKLDDMSSRITSIESKLASKDDDSSTIISSKSVNKYDPKKGTTSSMFPLDVLKGKGGRHFLPSSRSIFMGYFEAVRQRQRGGVVV